jgi:hypothetical protein
MNHKQPQVSPVASRQWTQALQIPFRPHQASNLKHPAPPRMALMPNRMQSKPTPNLECADARPCDTLMP